MSTTHLARPATTFTRSLVSIGRDESAPRAALRVGVSVLVPLVVLLLIGHIEWSVYGAFGAFASVYGRNVAQGARLRMQATAGLVMVVSVVLGSAIALTPQREWLTVAIASVWAVVVALLSQAARFTPPGPLFAVFALCAVASIPATSIAGGSGFGDAPAVSIVIAVVVSAASAVFALLVGQVGALAARSVQSAQSAQSVQSVQRRAPGEAVSTQQRGSGGPTAGAAALARLASVLRSRASLLSAARFGVALAVAGSLSTALGIGHPYWAMVAAVVPLVAFELAQTMVRGTHRVLGTLVGLVLAWGLLLLQPAGLWAILLVVALQVVAELMVLRNYGVALIFITPLALVMVSMAHPTDPSALIADRGVETLLGTLVAVAVALVWSAARTASSRRPGRP
ncbi:FUSC family protein [Subtercola sp. YIM 133946]|uniref:FUSC family protein n=1 Tax=Subtercola sp. YIM 133946 TaxID=3118909 RepID=UPI002F93CD5B